MTSVSIFHFTQIDDKYFSDFDTLKKCIKKLDKDVFVMPCLGKADETFIAVIKQKADTSDGIVFIIGDEQTDKYFYGLGLGDGLLIKKTKPILFIYAGEKNNATKNQERFVLNINELSNQYAQDVITDYLEDNLENFWIHYAKFIVTRTNNKLSINFEILEDTAIVQALIDRNPSNYKTHQLNIIVIKMVTTNYHEFSDSLIAENHSNAIYIPKESTMQTDKNNPVKIFISYSKSDVHHKDTLLKHLSGLRGKIITWNDQDLRGGEEWDETIKAELNKADIVLYLVSAHSMATDYIQTVELPLIEGRCQKKECKLIPVIVDFCDWENSVFAKYNALPDKGVPVVHKTHWNSESEAWLKVAKGVRQLVEG